MFLSRLLYQFLESSIASPVLSSWHLSLLQINVCVIYLLAGLPHYSQPHEDRAFVWLFHQLFLSI